MVKRILLVDDYQDILHLVSETLGRDTRCALLLAHGGTEGLALAQRELPDLVLLDIHMPGTDGIAVCQALKADAATAHIKVVMLTGEDSEEERQRAAGAGAVDYVLKPFSPTTLLEKLESLLDL